MERVYVSDFWVGCDSFLVKERKKCIFGEVIFYVGFVFLSFRWMRGLKDFSLRNVVRVSCFLIVLFYYFFV